VRILFWNVNRKDLSEHICQIVKTHSVDVIALNECAVPLDKTLRRLQSQVASI
jgi:exonuclease III